MVGLLAKLLGGIFSTKTLLAGLVMTTIGIVLYNLVVGIVQEAMNFALIQINGADYGSVTNPSFSGFAGWFIAQLKLPECLSVITSCVALKFILRKIPFLKW